MAKSRRHAIDAAKIVRCSTGDRPRDKFTAVLDMLAAVAAARSVPWRRRLLGILGVDA